MNDEPPRFVDAHCHVLPSGLRLLELDLREANSIEQVLDLVRDRNVTHKDGWLQVAGYDQNRYGRHIHRAELDAISHQRPILLRHVNGHAGVANSGALQAAGLTLDSVNPEGGAYGRSPDGDLDGLLLEQGLEVVSAAAPIPDLETMVEAILAAGKQMREAGFVQAADMMTGRFDLKRELDAYRIARERGCPVKTFLYVQWSSMFGPKADSRDEIAERASGLLGGVKIFADGAIGSATAAIKGSYERKPANTDGWSGQLIHSPETLNAMVEEAAREGWQVSVHSIGDYSTDLVMNAFARTEDSSKHRIEHAMILSDEQIERLAKLGCHVCVQPEFLLRFGHAYVAQLGPERASKLVRVRSLLDAGAKVCFSTDRPIVPGNPLAGIEAATNRPDIYNPSENCSKEEAILAFTTAAAKACLGGQ